MGLMVLNNWRLISPDGSRNQGPPVGHTFGSTTSGKIKAGLRGSSHLFTRKVAYTVSGPPKLTSMVYWPAARSVSMREASWLELTARYSISMLKRCLKAAGIFVRASGTGGPLTTILPSFCAAATNWSQAVAAAVVCAGAALAVGWAPGGAVGAGALAGAVVGAHAPSATPSSPVPVAPASRSTS